MFNYLFLFDVMPLAGYTSLSQEALESSQKERRHGLETCHIPVGTHGKGRKAAFSKGMRIKATYEVHLLLESLPRSELRWTHSSEFFLPLHQSLVEALI